MKKQDFLNSIITVLDEPIKLSLWWTILINPRITTKELKKKLNLKGNSVYYYLNHLEELKLIESELENIPNSNLTKKKFSISNDFLKSKFNGELVEEFKDNKRDVLLFELLLMNTLLNQTIMSTKLLSEKDFTKQIHDNSIPFGELLLINEESLAEIKELYNKLIAISKKTTKENELIPSGSVYGVLFACLPIQ